MAPSAQAGPSKAVNKDDIYCTIWRCVQHEKPERVVSAILRALSPVRREELSVDIGERRSMAGWQSEPGRGLEAALREGELSLREVC